MAARLLPILTTVAYRSPFTGRGLSALSARGLARAAVASVADQEPVAGLAYDLETTGLDPHSSEIVQLAIVCANSRRNAQFSRLVLPVGEVEPGAAAVHGWSKERLAAEGALPFAEVWRECEEWLEATFNTTRPLVWAAHNGDRFDRPILLRCVQEADASRSSALDAPRAVWVDTLKMARRQMPRRSGPGSHTLGRLHEDAGCGALVNAHDALVDARALSQVWKWLVAEAEAARDESAAAGAAADASYRDATFQAYLQRVGYGGSEPDPAEERGGARRSGAERRGGAARVARTRSAAAAAAATDDLLDFPGVGQ